MSEPKAVDHFVANLSLDTSGFMKAADDAAKKLASVTGPDVRLACLDRARDMARPLNAFSYNAEGHAAWIRDTIEIADRLAAFVLHGTVPTKN